MRFLFYFWGATKYYQASKFNNDGTGTISLTYSAKSVDVKKANNLIGNLPFTNELANEYFNSAGSKVTKAMFYKSQGDSSIQNATIELAVTDFNLLSKCKGFSDVTASWSKSDSGMVFRWLFSPSHKTKNEIESYQMIVDFESDLKSTNGVLAGKQVRWFVYTDKMNPNGAFFVATINSDGTTKAGKEITKNGSEGSKGGKEGEKEKSCGLFGLELPLVLLGWLVFANRKNTSNKN
ncbi:MAG: hypothetical protein IPL67_17585 [Ignavibacteria bacterium]|nr:hypothetical protein [Ignavibacteria bacterium]